MKENNLNFINEQKDKIIDAMRFGGAAVGYLFGSCARGTAGFNSDIDVAVAFPRDMAMDLQEKNTEEIRNSLERIFGRDKADVVNVGALKNPLLLYLIVLGEGKVLFAGDASLKNSIARRALRDFEDTKFLRKIQSNVLRRKFA